MQAQLGTRLGHAAAGGLSTCATTDGGVYCWGVNNHGQLGDGSGTNSVLPVGVSGLTPSDISSGTVAAGENHTCLLTDGSVRCWGGNAYGQLGTGNNSDANTPQWVVGHAPPG